jgi:hypothetical protein
MAVAYGLCKSFQVSRSVQRRVISAEDRRREPGALILMKIKHVKGSNNERGFETLEVGKSPEDEWQAD